MEAPSKRVLAVVAAVVVVAVAATVVFVSGGDPEPGEITALSDAYEDADERFVGTTDGQTTRSHSFQVGPGIAAMTLARSFSTSDPMSFAILDTEGDRRGGFDTEDGGFEVANSWTSVHRPDPGTWEVVIQCEGPCRYNVAIYLDDVIEPPADRLADDVASHETIITGDHDRGVSESETFEVPEGAQTVEFTWSVYAPSGYGIQLVDPSGETTNAWANNAEALWRQVSMDLGDQPQPGTWTVGYGCSQGCEIAFGITPVAPPGGGEQADGEQISGEQASSDQADEATE